MWEEDEGEVCSRPSRKPKVASVVCLAFKFIMGWIKMCLSFNNSSFVWKMWSFNHPYIGGRVGRSCYIQQIDKRVLYA